MKMRTVVVVLFLGMMVGLAGGQRVNRRGFDVVEATIAETQSALLASRVTCRGLVETYLRRIAAYDQVRMQGAGALNTVVTLNPAALAEAEACDARVRALQGPGPMRPMRPLEGIAVVVKDNYNTAGLQTTGGSLAMKGFMPAADADMVRRVRAAGGIVLFKSNMAEWAFSPVLTESSIAGITRNPYDLTRVPAGSSGGTGASVAANLGEVGLGTDTGDSVRGPAAHNGLVGIRPTIGLTSRAGIVPLFLTADVGGPLARTVADAAVVLGVVAGYDPADPITKLSEGKREADYTKFLDKDGLKGARIGVFRRYVDAATGDPQVKALTERAIAEMKAQGAVIVDPFEVPEFEALTKDIGCGDFQADLNAYLATYGANAPYKSLQAIVDSGLYLPSLDGRLKRALAPRTDAACEDVYHDAKKGAFRAAMVKAMDAAKVDAVVYPTWSNAPRKVGEMKSPGGDNNQVLSPQTGMPAITVPMGWTHPEGAPLLGMPAGIQFLGRLWSEGELIRLAYAYEQATKWRRAPVGFEAMR